MSIHYTIFVDKRDYSRIELHNEEYNKKIIIPFNDSVKFFHNDECTYNELTNKITIINSKIKKKLIIGIITINKKIIHKMNSNGFPYYIFTPSSIHYPKFFVSLNNKIINPKHQSSYYILIKYIDWHPNDIYPTGELIKILGIVGVNEDIEYKKILYEYDLLPLISIYRKKKKKIYKFNKKIISFNTTIYDLIPNENRKKYTNNNIITIDPINCTDIDDALHYSYNSLTNIHQIGIHIADVAYWVSLLDLHKYLNNVNPRYCTIYTKFKKYYIFPKIFSEHIFSLKENTDRLAISLLIDFKYDIQKKQYIMKNYSIQETIINVSKNYSYEEIKKNQKIFKKLFQISKSIIPECNINVIDAHDMVQKYMILYNKIIAEILVENNANVLLRTLKKKKNTISNNNNNNLPIKVQNFLKYYLSNSATYTLYNSGINTTHHHGLNLKYYTHSTSPIRRIIDIYHQYELKKTLKFNKNNCKIDYKKLNENTLKYNKMQKKINQIFHNFNTINPDIEYVTYKVSEYHLYIPTLNIVVYDKNNEKIYQKIIKKISMNCVSF